MNSVRNLFVLLSAILFGSIVQAATLNVPTVTYPTIQSAVDAADSSDTIQVAAGTYAESIDINKDNLTVQSVSGNPADTIIDANGVNTNVVDVFGCSGVTISGFTIKGAVGKGYISGVSMKNVSGCSLSNNVITSISTSGNGVYGIELENAISNNFSSLAISGIAGPGNAAGVLMSNSSRNAFRSIAVSTIGGNSLNGFYLSGSRNNSFEATTVSNLISTVQVTGFYLHTDSSSNSFNDTKISYLTGRDYSAYGISLWSGTNTFTSTKISHLTSKEVFGLNIKFSAIYNVFSGFDISNPFSSGNTLGIYTDRLAHDNSFTGGNIKGHLYAAYLNNGANSIHSSDLSGNSLFGVKNVFQASGSDQNRVRCDATSNWWGNVTGPTHATNPGGNGIVVTDNVDFSPWLGDGTDTSAVIGFQPNLEPLYYTAKGLTFGTQPGGALLGEALSRQPVVTVTNAIGGVALQFNGSIALAIGTNPGVPVAGVLNGTATLTFFNGLASFTELSIGSGTGDNYTLVATTAGLPPVTSATFNIENSVPVLTAIGNKNVTEQVELTFTATANDHDGAAQTLTFSLTDVAGENYPDGATIDGTTGVFTWTPTKSQGGTSYTFTVVVTDNGTGLLSASETITVAVAEVILAPTRIRVL